MKLIIFDSETTGLAKDRNASYKEIDKWPRLVQLAWVVYNDRALTSRVNYIVKPCGFIIPKSSSDIHGITTEQASEQGDKIEKVLTHFLEDCKDADALIGHNIKFDLNVVQAEMHRLNLGNLLAFNTLDTMELSVDYCKIPNNQHGYRFPKLIELYSKLFSRTFDDMHNAMADVLATAKCFWSLYDRRIINREDFPYLLTNKERQELGEKYNRQAHAIVSHSKPDDQRKEALFLKSAQLGNLDSMLHYAAIKSVSTSGFDVALFWLNKIFLELQSENKIDSELYENVLYRIKSIYKRLGDKKMFAKFNELYRQFEERRKQNIINNHEKSESDFYKYVLSYYEGIYGFEKNKEYAHQLIEKGIVKGFRSLYKMYSKYLREKGDNRYLHYRLEHIKDVEKKISEEFESNEAAFGSSRAVEVYRWHKELWLTSEYTFVAQEYLDGLYTEQNVPEAIVYLKKAFQCDFEDKETAILYARVCNGEYGKQYINYDESIRVLERICSKYMDNKMPYALLGDAFFGKSAFNFIKAGKAYHMYGEISNYKSAIRTKYKFFLCALILVLLSLIGLLFI